MFTSAVCAGLCVLSACGDGVFVPTISAVRGVAAAGGFDMFEMAASCALNRTGRVLPFKSDTEQPFLVPSRMGTGC